jgi:hypothetical protein
MVLRERKAKPAVVQCWSNAMKKLLIGLLFASAAFAQSGPGLYLERAGAAVKMEHAAFSGVATKGVAKSVFVPGAGISVVWEFPGATAAIDAGANPSFTYLATPDQGLGEFVIVRMDQKSDHREMRVTKSNGWTGDVRLGYDAKKLIALRVSRSGNTIEISPAAALAPGEYFLTAGFSPRGYDFTVGAR